MTVQSIRETHPAEKTGSITAALLAYETETGARPFGGSSGADAASYVLGKAAAICTALQAGFDDKGGELDALENGIKGMAIAGVGDLIRLAQILCEEA